jgi:hypothetical protein
MQCPDLLASGPCHKALQAQEGDHCPQVVKPVVGTAGAHAASTFQLVDVLPIQTGAAPEAAAAGATAGTTGR